MQEPLQISFHNMAPSEALERRVREQWAKVERHYDGIISARIALEAPHKQPHKSTLGIAISIGVPAATSWFGASSACTKPTITPPG